MITRDEIKAKSQEFKIHEVHVERDYVNSWFLAGLFTISPLKDSFVLKGANCLRKAYFQDTRFTVDLDFSVSAAIDRKAPSPNAWHWGLRACAKQFGERATL